MEVILLERVPRLGQMGEVVRVKDGFARNFLLPRGKALRATEESRTRFEAMKSELAARSLDAQGRGCASRRHDRRARALRFSVRPRKQVSCSARCRRATWLACWARPAST